MKKIITAINNPIINEKLKKEKIEVIGKDIQYKEGILEILENNKEINFILINENLPGEIKNDELINKIKKINKNIEIIFFIKKENKKNAIIKEKKIIKDEKIKSKIKIVDYEKEIKIESFLNFILYGEEILGKEYEENYTNRIDIINEKIEKYDIYFLSAYFIMYKCLLPEYWIDSNLEVWKTERLKKDDVESKKENSSNQEYELTNNKKFMYDTWISHWIDEGRGYKDRVEGFINLSKSDLFTFMDRFLKLEFCCENVVEEVNTAIEFRVDNLKNIKEFLYIDVPKYITEYERFNFDTKKMGDVFEMLSEYEGEWILPWKTYVEKDIRLNEEKRNKKDTEISSVRDRMYTKKRELTDSAYCTDILSAVEEDINIKDIYDTMKIIDERHNLFVFDYRDKDKNKPQSIVFITNIDFEKVDDIQFQTKYNLDFEYNGRLRKRTFKEFYEEMTKWIPS